MWFIFSMPVLIRHLWQLKAVVFKHWCLICTVILGRVFEPCLKSLAKDKHSSLFGPLISYEENKGLHTQSGKHRERKEDHSFLAKKCSQVPTQV